MKKQPLNVLIGCETSGIVRDAFLAAGHNAVSCDLLPTDSPGPHYQGDVLDIIYDEKWDIGIFHPTCQYLCNSGVRWLYDENGDINEDRWALMDEAAEFFKVILHCGIPKICVENPVMHGHAMAIIKEHPNQYIQPYDFGNDASKKTGLWLKGLPCLIPDPKDYVPPRIVNGLPRWANQTDSGQNNLGPSDLRWKIRAETYPGREWPGSHRQATGVKNRVNRLRCLGNALVPLQVYPFFKAIGDIERIINGEQ